MFESSWTLVLTFRSCRPPLARYQPDTLVGTQLVYDTDMTGRPGYRTMEMIGGSSAPYLARTPCVPLFCTSFNRVGNKERFRLPGAGGGSFPLYGGTFARSYSEHSLSTIPLLSLAGADVVSFAER